jgi:hypothetical protein
VNRARVRMVPVRSPSIVAILVACTSAGASGQESVLQTTRSWRCEFTTRAANNWLGEEPVPEVGEEQFVVNLDSVDTTEGTARMIGNVGASDLYVIAGVGTLHFVEVTPSGNLNVTTIFDAPGAAGMKASHSRHVLILGSPLPAQHYGYCRPW